MAVHSSDRLTFFAFVTVILTDPIASVSRSVGVTVLVPPGSDTAVAVGAGQIVLSPGGAADGAME